MSYRTYDGTYIDYDDGDVRHTGTDACDVCGALHVDGVYIDLSSEDPDNYEVTDFVCWDCLQDDPEVLP